MIVKTYGGRLVMRRNSMAVDATPCGPRRRSASSMPTWRPMAKPLRRRLHPRRHRDPPRQPQQVRDRPRHRPGLPRPAPVHGHRPIPPTTGSSPTRSAATATRSTRSCCSRTRCTPACGCEARPVGVLYMEDEAGEDAKIICVPPGEPRWEDVARPRRPARRSWSSEIQHFFEVYKALEPGKYVDAPRGLAGRDGGLAGDRGSRKPPTSPRPLTGRRRLRGSSAGQRSAALRPSAAAPIAPACSPSSAKASAGCGRMSGRVEQRVEPRGDRRQVQVGGVGEPAAEHEHRRVEQVGQVDQPERDPPGELVDHGERPAGRRRSAALAHVLAAHARRSSPASATTAAPSRPATRRLAGQHRQPGDPDA